MKGDRRILRILGLLILALNFWGCATNEERVQDLSISQEKRALIKKLDSTVINKVEFKKTPLRAVVEFLRSESKRKDPTGKGVPMIVKAGVFAEPEVFLSLENVSLVVALKSVTQSVGWVYRIEENQVVIFPLHSE